MRSKTNNKERNQKSKIKKKQAYLLSITVMVLLVVGALYLPQMIFSIQDKYQIGNTQVQARSYPDIAQWNLAYEEDLNTRMRNYLDLSNKTATAIEYEVSENSEVKELATSVFYEEWFGPLMYDNNFITNYIYTMEYEESLDLIISDCKKYLIHGADYQDGVAFVMWYLDLDLAPVGIRIRLLVDAETGTIYYMKVTADDTKEDTADNITDSATVSYSEDNIKLLYYLHDIMLSNYDFYFAYYEPDNVLPEESNVSEYYKFFRDTDVTAKQVWWIDSTVDDNRCELSFFMPYGELSANFVFQAEYKDGIYADITMGIPIIGEMIPEMIQD